MLKTPDINYSGGGETDRGAPVYATHDGVVKKVTGFNEDSNSGGSRITIQSKDGSLQTVYMHLDEKPNFKVGDEIKEGQLIGKLGQDSEKKNIMWLIFTMRFT